MKKILSLLLIVIALSSCNSRKKAEPVVQKPVITVSILPQKTFIEKIAGDDFDINVLIPPGASPAAYTLLPSQLKDIANSVAWFRIGYIGFEHSWNEKITGANKNMKVFDLSEGLDLAAGEEEVHGDHVHFHGVDPHIWLSPALVKKMAKKIRDILSEIHPEGASKYMDGYNNFTVEIDKLNVELKNKFRGYESRTVIVFHPSLTYFARDYGLNQVSLESGGKEPTPQHIKEVVDLANKENIRIIFIQSEFDREHARIFAEEIGGKIVQVSPLSPDWSENLLEMADDVIESFK
ncbi:MAG: zinc ABC transporter substrate-binding protein [Prolixibacteraceae bacterium]|nr:zinc ABC transporter substrate-binding protein [Prolixibacteraceae bacterium]